MPTHLSQLCSENFCLEQTGICQWEISSEIYLGITSHTFHEQELKGVVSMDHHERCHTSERIALCPAREREFTRARASSSEFSPTLLQLSILF